MFFIFVIFLLLGMALRFFWLSLGAFGPKLTLLEKSMIMGLSISFILFLAMLSSHSSPYYVSIDPMVEPYYSPISYKHSIFFIAFHLLAVWSLIKLFKKGLNLPPLQTTLYTILVTIGIIINAQFIFQISYHDISKVEPYDDVFYPILCLAAYPSLLIISSFSILKFMITSKAEINKDVVYTQKWLNWLNQKLCSLSNLPLMSMLLVIPIFVIVMIILVIFGQDVDILNKVYSETATWRLSEHIHPPPNDDKHGHYLCTVAACGSPNLVKPIAIGNRNNQPILVNRQLQIANAFECIIEQSTPRLHTFIRRNYDLYGLNLAKRINTSKMANLTYLLMKPLEWIFLIVIYTFQTHPEKLITSQYRSTFNIQ